MSVNNQASFAESMPISQVVQELRDRGLNTEAPDRELRADLAQAIFAENGIYLRREAAQGQATGSSPLDTVREVDQQQAPTGGSMPGRPPAESTRLNGDFRSTGAIPKRLGLNRSAPGGILPRPNPQ